MSVVNISLNWKIVKVATTKAQRKLFFNLRKSKNSLGWLTQGEATNIAKDLNVETKDVIEMESRLFQHDSFFDAAFGDDIADDYIPGAAKANCLEDHYALIQNSFAFQTLWKL